MQGIIKINFDDLERFFKAEEFSKICVGYGKGKDKVQKAIKRALSMHDITLAERVIIAINGDPKMDMKELAGCSDVIRKVVDENCEMVLGANIDETLKDECQIIIAAVGIIEKKVNYKDCKMPEKAYAIKVIQEECADKEKLSVHWVHERFKINYSSATALLADLADDDILETYDKNMTIPLNEINIISALKREFNISESEAKKGIKAFIAGEEYIAKSSDKYKAYKLK